MSERFDTIPSAKCEQKHSKKRQQRARDIRQLLIDKMQRVVKQDCVVVDDARVKREIERERKRDGEECISSEYRGR